LNTDLFSVASWRLAEFTKDKRDAMGDDSAAVRSGKMTAADLVKILNEHLDVSGTFGGFFLPNHCDHATLSLARVGCL
jgi:hypothetical protein